LGLGHAPLIYLGFNYGTGYCGAPITRIIMMTIAGTVVGVLLSYVTLKSESVIPACILHGSMNVIGIIDLQMHIINPKNVFYFESVDNTVFMYCQKQFLNSGLSSTKLRLNMRIGIFLGPQNQLSLIFLK